MNSLIQKITRIPYLHPGIRSRIANALHRKPFSFETDFFGICYQGDTSSYIDRFVYYMGAYEAGILNLIAELKMKHDISTFVDIGGNIGHHSLFASTIFDKVHAFEPYPVVLKQFRKNVSNNQIQNIEIHEFGLGEKEEELEYFEPQGENQGTGSFLSNFSPNNKSKNLKLKIKRGEFLSTLGLDKAIVKIDTEGFEPQVLKGIRSFLEETPSIVVVEISRSEEIDKDLADFLEARYDIFHIENQFKQKVDLIHRQKLEGRDTYFLLVDKRFPKGARSLSASSRNA